jgi:uncharacterized MAPEG superfamily protein
LTTELWMLAWSAIFCIVMWIPYVLARVQVWGLLETMGYPPRPPALPEWALRLQKAHANMVENLPAFAAIVLIAHVANVHNGATELGALLFFAGRLGFTAIYVAKIVVLRTLAFVISWIGTVLIFLQLF